MRGLFHRFLTAARSKRSLILASVAGVLLLSACASVPHKPPVTVEQIVQMSHDGVAPSAIVEQLRESGTVYRLSASEFARLSTQGVSNEVLDYMQSTYLDDARRDGYRYAGPYAYGYYSYGWVPGYGYWGPPSPVFIPYRPRFGHGGPGFAHRAHR
ncbi:MAG: hypothetical protein ABI612_15670 [Betaproteobacteria bacterium]